jgi:hypothetical protein
MGSLGLFSLNLSDDMVQGSQYVFHFTYSGLGIRPDMSALSQLIAADTNFATPVAAAESNGVQVRFVYQGLGSNVGAAGSEMQDVINSSFTVLGFFNGLNFSSAEGGPAGQTTAPGQQDNSGSGNSTNWSDFFKGLATGTGGGLLLAGGVLWVLLRD